MVCGRDIVLIALPFSLFLSHMYVLLVAAVDGDGLFSLSDDRCELKG